MFTLFFSLYFAMLRGTWQNIATNQIPALVKPVTNSIGEFLTSLFNNVDTPMSSLGDALFQEMATGGSYYMPFQALVAVILALITSIGIVVMAVKGVKKAFGIFFMLMR